MLAFLSPEESVESTRVGVISGCELPYVGARKLTQTLCLLVTEPSLQSCPVYLNTYLLQSLASAWLGFIVSRESIGT